MAEKPANVKLLELIGDWNVTAWALENDMSAPTVYRLLRTGKTNNLRHAVQIQRASGGAILPEEWL